MARDNWRCDDAALTVLSKPLKPREVIRLEKLFFEDMARWRLEQQMERPPKRRFVEPEGAALEALRAKVEAVNDRLTRKAKVKTDRAWMLAEKRRHAHLAARLEARRARYAKT